LVGVDGHIGYEGLTLLSHEGDRELLKNLNVEIPHGTRLLVVGPNEDAKVALFRATAGIWPAGSGKVVRPGLDDLVFLPQRPYLPPGTLRELLVGNDHGISDDQITTILRDVGLGAIPMRAGGLDTEHDWPDILSLGEQQLLALTRLTIARPAFIFLDRAATSLKPAQVRDALRRFNEKAVGYIAFAEDVESVELYDAVLEINSDGAWTWNRISRAA